MKVSLFEKSEGGRTNEKNRFDPVRITHRFERLCSRVPIIGGNPQQTSLSVLSFLNYVRLRHGNRNCPDFVIFLLHCRNRAGICPNNDH